MKYMYILLVFVWTNATVPQWPLTTAPVSGIAGLYASKNDFIHHKLTEQMDCHSGDRISSRDFFGGSKIYTNRNGQKRSFDKQKLFGYHSCNGKNYRFFKTDSYEIIDTAGFYMYYRYSSREVSKGKGLVKVDEYYFSRDPDSPIELLTAIHLKNAFPANNRFHYAVDANFRTDNELIAYDTYARAYKIAYLYKQSINP